MKKALKEWAVLLEAMAAGRQRFLLRKGGILESSSGFQLECREFAFFPTWEHQQRDWVRPEFQGLFDRAAPADDSEIELRYIGRVKQVRRAPEDPTALIEAQDRHIWTPEFLRMRYAYRPDLPLYEVETELWELEKPVRTALTDAMRGCRSWVELPNPVVVERARRVVDTTQGWC